MRWLDVNITADVLRIDRSRSYTGESPDVELTAHIDKEGAFRLTVDTNEGVDYEDMRELLDTAEQYLDEHAAELYHRAERELEAQAKQGYLEDWE
jgi:hypothetical protein